MGIYLLHICSGHIYDLSLVDLRVYESERREFTNLNTLVLQRKVTHTHVKPDAQAPLPVRCHVADWLLGQALLGHTRQAPTVINLFVLQIALFFLYVLPLAIENDVEAFFLLVLDEPDFYRNALRMLIHDHVVGSAKLHKRAKLPL